MSGQTYYIDPLAGADANSGLHPDQPFQNYEERPFLPGDTIRFKRGSVYRGELQTREGSEEGVVTYGAYGSGPKPTFLGSVSANGTERWVEERPSVWRCLDQFPSEVCNLIFNHGEAWGNLRWNLSDLQSSGEWHYTSHGSGGAGAAGSNLCDGKPAVLYLFSAVNPGLAYSDIECALWGRRQLASGRQYLVFEDLAFRNGGVHGFQGLHVSHLTFGNCDFHFIGGAVWDASHRIRFGNAIEFWDGASDILVEGCVFDKIYDSGVTHQGGGTQNIPERIHFRNNLFIDNGMSAYESREPGKEIYFEYNTCIHAGGGFSMQGETPPRQSEIYPEPMGHHVFIWRIEKGTQPGHVYIRHNIFYEAPYGSAIYSCIDPVDERTFVIDHNCYWQTTGSSLAKLNHRSYRPEEFAEYQRETGQDSQSIVEDPLFIDAGCGDYRLRAGSPAEGFGIQDEFLKELI